MMLKIGATLTNLQHAYKQQRYLEAQEGLFVIEGAEVVRRMYFLCGEKRRLSISGKRDIEITTRNHYLVLVPRACSS